MNPKTYQLLIFDWDGTLSDSAAQIVRAVQFAINGLKLPPRSDESIRELIGLGLNEALGRLYPELELEHLRGLLSGFRAHWLSEGAGEAPLFEHALQAVQGLHADGYRIAVATGKSRRGLDRSFKHHADFKRMVSCSRCADETLSKPDPLMLKEILEHEQLNAQDALMIGDTEFDMAMARSIGMPALGVTCGVHEPGRLLKAGAKTLIENVGRLPAWLRQAEPGLRQ